MAAGTHRDHKRSGRLGQRGRVKGRGHPYRRPQTASANAAQQTSSFTCYKCDETGHIAPQCPNNGRTSSGNPLLAPPHSAHALLHLLVDIQPVGQALPIPVEVATTTRHIETLWFAWHVPFHMNT